MKREIEIVLIAIALIAAAALEAPAETSKSMDCSQYNAMNKAGRMGAVDAMRSRMPAANKMASSREMADKVDARCKQRPGTMVDETMKKAMPQ